ncbi:zinc-dependent metalloprotease [uncultured Tenacibaculum sp.]|uniref:zinc-dependent metalloprotease n=1 Tax=uncultured Tenacibaculum sp. TaxID=174713 RepID=UPI0026140451|nr:zinc-dependent metalloprotease [uncultured Tenacibaculum sp.]
MKKIYTLILFIITINTYAQQCGFDQYIGITDTQNNTVIDEINHQIVKIIDTKRRRQNTTREDKIITIPVVFNLVYPQYYQLGQGANVHGSVLHQQIRILNERYSGALGGADTKIRFCIAQKNALGFKQIGINRFNGNESYQPWRRRGNIPKIFKQVDAEIKSNRSNNFPSDTFLNIWIINLIDENGGDNFAGYSSSPIAQYNRLETIDGVVLNYKELNKYTAEHEIGHWLGLFHVFANFNISGASKDNNCDEINCEMQGDFICDTENVAKPGLSNIAPGTCKGYNCNGKITSVVQNFMDYQKREREFCYKSFTLGQKERMQNVLELYRANIYNNSVLGLNNYCDASDLGGGGFISPLKLNCKTCYEPNLRLPDDFRQNSLVIFENTSKGNLYVENTVANGGIYKTRIYERDCLNFTLVQTIEGNNTIHTQIIDNKTFINYGNRKNTGTKDIIIYKKNNIGIWSSVNEYNYKEGTFINIQNNKKGTYLITRHPSENIIKVSIYNKVENNFSQIKTINVSPFNNDTWHYVTISDKSIFIKTKKDEVQEWEINNNGNNLSYKDLINIPLTGNYIDGANRKLPGDLFEMSAYDNLLIVSELRNENTSNPWKPKERVFNKVYEKTGSIWNLIQEIETTNRKRATLPFLINKDYLILKANTYRDKRIYFLKKETDGKFHFLNLNHMYPNSPEAIDYFCSNTFSLNTSTQEVTLDDMILKLNDILKIDTSKFDFSTLIESTTKVCQPSTINIYEDYNIILGGNNCNLNTNNTKITAQNSIRILPKSHIKGKADLKIFNQFNNCKFIGKCDLSSNNINLSILKLRNHKTDTYKKVKNQESDILLYPNPNKGLLYFSKQDSINIKRVEIYNTLGMLVHQTNTIKQPIKLTTLQNGLYNVIITLDNQQKIAKKIIVQL